MSSARSRFRSYQGPWLSALGDPQSASAAHKLCPFLTHYAGSVTTAGGPVARVGPVQISIPVSALGRVPRRVQSLDLYGMEWKVDSGTLRITAGAVGLHGVLAIE